MPYLPGFPCLLCVCHLPEARMFGPQGDKINCRVLENWLHGFGNRQGRSHLGAGVNFAFYMTTLSTFLYFFLCLKSTWGLLNPGVNQALNFASSANTPKAC